MLTDFTDVWPVARHAVPALDFSCTQNVAAGHQQWCFSKMTHDRWRLTNVTVFFKIRMSKSYPGRIVSFLHLRYYNTVDILIYSNYSGKPSVQPACWVFRGWLTCLKAAWDQICCELALGYELIIDYEIFRSTPILACSILRYVKILSSALQKKCTVKLFFIFLYIIDSTRTYIQVFEKIVRFKFFWQAIKL